MTVAPAIHHRCHDAGRSLRCQIIAGAALRGSICDHSNRRSWQSATDSVRVQVNRGCRPPKKPTSGDIIHGFWRSCDLLPDNSAREAGSGSRSYPPKGRHETVCSPALFPPLTWPTGIDLTTLSAFPCTTVGQRQRRTDDARSGDGERRSRCSCRASEDA